MKRFGLIALPVLGAFLLVMLASGCAGEGFTATKEQFIRDTKAQIDYYQVKIDELKEKAAGMTGTAREEADRKIERLKWKQQEARDRLEEAESATRETWDKTKSDLKDVLGDLKDFYEDAVSAVK
jgi:FtsZ-binding cell division protein ZapB